jgi:hypothetical protein
MSNFGERASLPICHRILQEAGSNLPDARIFLDNAECMEEMQSLAGTKEPFIALFRSILAKLTGILKRVISVGNMSSGVDTFYAKCRNYGTASGQADATDKGYRQRNSNGKSKKCNCKYSFLFHWKGPQMGLLCHKRPHIDICPEEDEMNLDHDPYLARNKTSPSYRSFFYNNIFFNLNNHFAIINNITSKKSADLVRSLLDADPSLAAHQLEKQVRSSLLRSSMTDLTSVPTGID